MKRITNMIPYATCTIHLLIYTHGLIGNGMVHHFWYKILTLQAKGIPAQQSVVHFFACLTKDVSIHPWQIIYMNVYNNIMELLN